jgi:hypothetical protein
MIAPWRDQSILSHEAPLPLVLQTPAASTKGGHTSLMISTDTVEMPIRLAFACKLPLLTKFLVKTLMVDLGSSH